MTKTPNHDEGWEDRTTAVSFDQLAAKETKVDEAYLIVLAGSRVGEMVKVGNGVVIGRGIDVDFRVNDEGVSRSHVRVTQDDNGNIIVEDMESMNGTFINGRKIAGALPIKLSDGDKIQIGSTAILKFSYADRLDESFQQRMYEAALRDPLTGLFNRRYFLEQLEGEFSYVTRHRSDLSVVMMDIDHFKKVNDNYGHIIGDKVLVGFAEKLRGTIRNEDLAARYGGEEFVLVCRGVLPDTAMHIAKRICGLIENARLATPEFPDLKVTISAGVAGFPQVGINSVQGLIDAADKALYRAKQEGRNRVCLHTV